MHLSCFECSQCTLPWLLTDEVVNEVDLAVSLADKRWRTSRAGS